MSSLDSARCANRSSPSDRILQHQHLNILNYCKDLQRSTEIYKGQISYLKSQHSTNPLPCLPCFVRHHSNSAKLREKSDKLLLMRKLSDCEVVLPIPLNWSNKDDSTLEAMHSTDWQQKINVCRGPIPPRTQVAWIPHIKGFGNLNIPLMQMTLSSSGRSRRCAGWCRNTWSWSCRWCRWCCRTTARGISPLTSMSGFVPEMDFYSSPVKREQFVTYEPSQSL